MAAIFGRSTLRATLFGALLSAGVQGGYYAVMTWLPSYLRTARNLSVIGSSGYLAVVIAAAWLGYVTGAYVSDALGRRRTFVLFSLCSIITVVVYTTVPISNSLMLVLGAPLGFFASGTYSGLGATLAELFPTGVRGSGMGFTYNFGRAIGAGFPALVGVLSEHTSLGIAIGLFTTVAYALVWVAIAGLPETKATMLRD